MTMLFMDISNHEVIDPWLITRKVSKFDDIIMIRLTRRLQNKVYNLTFSFSEYIISYRVTSPAPK